MCVFSFLVTQDHDQVNYMHICTCASLEALREYWREALKVKNMEIKIYLWDGGGGLIMMFTCSYIITSDIIRMD